MFVVFFLLNCKIIDFIDADVILEQIPKDSLLHHQLDPAIRRLLSKRKEKGRRKSHFNLRSLSMAKMIHIQNRPVVQYYFDVSIFKTKKRERVHRVYGKSTVV